MSENLFRVGGVYRDGNGNIQRIGGDHFADGKVGVEQFIPEHNGFRYSGLHRLSDGRFLATSWKSSSEYDLLPGELHNVNGEWLPIEDEMLALQTRPQHEPAACEEEKPSIWTRGIPSPFKINSDGTISPNTTETERKRSPLAYFSEAKRFDAFPGFITETGCVNGAGHRIGGVSPFRDLSLDGCDEFRAPKVL